MWTYANLLHHLDTIQEHRMVYGLERIRAGCERMGHPERCVPIVHIAGTNGKGSTVAFLLTLLQHAGYCVGTYTSPHLCDFTERIAMDGQPCDGDALAAIAETIVRACHDVSLTYFEFATLLALCTFAQQRPDIILMETGLGGRLDATNVASPVAIGITPISRDHMHLLGDTIEAITREKCGIFKPGVPIVSAPQCPDVTTIIRTTAAELHAPLTIATPTDPTLPLGLHGLHQRINAGVAHQLASVLATQGWRGADHAVLANTVWPGRCEWLRRDPPLLFDAAHNVAGAQALAKYLHTIRDQRPIECTIGMMEEKEAHGIITALLPVIDRFITVTPPSPRALPAATLAEIIREMGGSASVDTSDEWVHRCHSAGADAAAIHVVTGSCYLYAPLLIALGGQ